MNLNLPRRFATKASAWDARPSRARGLTLIEMTVAIGIVAILLGAVTVAIGSVIGTQAKAAAGQLSATIRSLYDAASLSGKTCRLAFELPDPKNEDGVVKYRAECATGNVTTSRDRDEAIEQEAKDAIEANRMKGSGTGGYGAFTGDEPTLQDLLGQEKARVAQASKYAAFTNEQIEPRSFPESVKVSVWTRHQRLPTKEGVAYLYFFPQGFTERAHVYVRQGNNVWTIVIAPLTGKTSIVAEELEVPKS